MGGDIHEIMWELHKQKNWETSFLGRLYTRVLFALGWSKCKHCVWCLQSDSSDMKHKTFREQVIIVDGKCTWSLGSLSSILDQSDMQTFKRCSAFVPMVYNVKGYGLDPKEIRDMRMRRSDLVWGVVLAVVGSLVGFLVGHIGK